jgi:hypothetical protein
MSGLERDVRFTNIQDRVWKATQETPAVTLPEGSNLAGKSVAQVEFGENRNRLKVGILFDAALNDRPEGPSQVVTFVTGITKPPLTVWLYETLLGPEVRNTFGEPFGEKAPTLVQGILPPYVDGTPHLLTQLRINT